MAVSFMIAVPFSPETVPPCCASKRSRPGGLKAPGAGSRHGDGGVLTYTGVADVAVLKKQGAGQSAGHRLDQAGPERRSAASGSCASPVSADRVRSTGLPNWL